MRVIVQRVRAASVTVDGQVVGAIESGLLVYVGVAQGDDVKDAEWTADKVAHLRIFEDDTGKMNLDAAQVGGRVLAVSNFSLLADARQGRRPSFTDAAPPETAQTLYERFCTALRAHGLSVETGRFRERMIVAAENDGPINIILESR